MKTAKKRAIIWSGRNLKIRESHPTEWVVMTGSWDPKTKVAMMLTRWKPVRARKPLKRAKWKLTRSNKPVPVKSKRNRFHNNWKKETRWPRTRMATGYTGWSRHHQWPRLESPKTIQNRKRFLWKRFWIRRVQLLSKSRKSITLQRRMTKCRQVVPEAKILRATAHKMTSMVTASSQNTAGRSEPASPKPRRTPDIKRTERVRSSMRRLTTAPNPQRTTKAARKSKRVSNVKPLKLNHPVLSPNSWREKTRKLNGNGGWHNLLNS